MRILAARNTGDDDSARQLKDLDGFGGGVTPRAVGIGARHLHLFTFPLADPAFPLDEVARLRRAF